MALYYDLPVFKEVYQLTLPTKQRTKLNKLITMRKRASFCVKAADSLEQQQQEQQQLRLCSAGFYTKAFL